MSHLSELKVKSPRSPRKPSTFEEDAPKKQLPRKKTDQSRAALQSKRDKKCNDDLQALIKVLFVFLIFDFATREFLF